jgi:hypothetical protein
MVGTRSGKCVDRILKKYKETSGGGSNDVATKRTPDDDSTIVRTHQTPKGKRSGKKRSLNKPRGKRDGEYGDEAMAARNANVILLNKKQQNSGAPSPSKHFTCPVVFLVVKRSGVDC